LQPDLQQFLRQFPVVREEYNYVIYDLRAPRRP
jgi:hypothetical protein